MLVRASPEVSEEQSEFPASSFLPDFSFAPLLLIDTSLEGLGHQENSGIRLSQLTLFILRCDVFHVQHKYTYGS